MSKPTLATDDVLQLVEKVKNKFHLPRLEQAKIAVSFFEGKPFVKNQLNWGRVKKVNADDKILQGDVQYDFHIKLCSDVWTDVLTHEQREALIDLHLNCCQVELEPEYADNPNETQEQKDANTKKKKPLKDKWGRIVYSDVPKYDDDGEPKWVVSKLNLHTFQDNVTRYGCWCEDLLDLKNAIKSGESKTVADPVMEAPSVE